MRLFFLITLVSLALSNHHGAQAQVSPTELPLISIDDLAYAGAFRLPAETFGASSLNFSEGPMTYNAGRHSLFIVGHNHQQAIAEFAIPELVKSELIADLNMASAPLQLFSSILGRTSDGNPQSIDRIGGMACFITPSGIELLVNGYEYYDAPADNTHSTLVIRDATNLSSSMVDGFFEFQGGAGHTSGWLSPIPDVWQSALGGAYITGQSSGIPIIGRASVGPSAFAFDPFQVVDNAQPPVSLTTNKLLDFSLDKPLHTDLSNDDGSNNLWTHLSRVVYGVILPGTRTYMTLGYSGGHNSGVCYKCTQNNGNVCGGYCTPDVGDNYQYFWLWDVNDLLAVHEGQKEAHDVTPYAYGPFPTPFENGAHALGGGTFDDETGMLYLTVQRADDQQGEYSNPPIVVGYQLNEDFLSVATEPDELPQQDAGFSIHPPYPNPFKTTTQFNIRVDATQRVHIRVHDILGREIDTIHNGVLTADKQHPFKIDAGNLPAGTYMVIMTGEQGQTAHKIVRLR